MMAEVQGHCDAKFQRVREIINEFLASGEEVGLSLAVNVDGRDVVDLWGGHADVEKARPWKRDTIVNVWSTTKILSSLAVLKLADEGRLSLDDKVAKHWPEFAANGKQDIEVRHILAHSAGLAGWAEPLTLERMCADLPGSTAMLAAQAPMWPPGTASGYHALTMGHLLGEIVRRVSGLSLTEFVSKKLAAPVDADLQIGCREADWPRVADVIPPPAVELFHAPPDSIAMKMLNPLPDPAYANTPTWRRAEVGAANGHSNAQGLVRVLKAVTLAGQQNSPGLLSKETVDSIFREQTNGADLGMGLMFRYGMGMALRLDGGSCLDDFLPEGRVCAWGGWGGSMGVMDLERKVTITYAMNKMSNDRPAPKMLRAYMKEIYSSLGVQT
ncbi:beta-lactamase [Xylariaceae sp. FL0016]|nr:beta-lactamase [Xylariaceae sp. FL0016]